ncbi:MAG: SgcJ/EcaC family oxidoreductase, partial [Bryobacteraceae bacterium]
MLPEDDQAIRALLVKMYEAWAMGNGSAYAACFTEDSDYVTFNGIRLRGRRENAELHDALFRGVLKGTR